MSPFFRFNRRLFLVTVCSALLAIGAWLPASDPWPTSLPADGPACIRAAFRSGIDEGLIAGGALLLLQDDQPIFREAFGLANLESKQPFTTETVCHMASTSKPHCSTLIMILVDEGLIDLDEPVSKYIPEMQEIRLIGSSEKVPVPTMRQLLSHTAGFESLARDTYTKVMELVFTHDTFAEAAKSIAGNGLAYRPGTDYRYTQLGMIVAGHVAETVTGQDWETLFREKLADPIGATASTWFPTQEVLDHMAVRYDLKEGQLTRRLPERLPRKQGFNIDPAGSLVSDLDSTSKLFLLHKNLGMANGKRVISEKSLNEIHTQQPGAKDYGLGMSLAWMPTDGTAPMFGHGGAYGTMAWADLETGIVGVLLVQTPPTPASSWHKQLYEALHKAGVGRMVEVQEGKSKAGAK